MVTLWVVLSCLAVVLTVVLIIAYYCYRKAFYVKKRKPAANPNKYPLPRGEAYEPFYDKIIDWHDRARELEYADCYITSHDGLRLYAKYYEHFENAPVEIFFHGYRSSAERDLIGGIFRCREQGRNVLLVSQRCSGKSQGKAVTFGVKEYKDCLAWVDYYIKNINPNGKIILSGLSMGAATVLMAASQDLPKNVVGVIADCGYSSPKAIIKTVIQRDMGLPPSICYPFVKLGGLLFAHFNTDEFSPLESMKKCKVPVLFIHGDNDNYVPCEMCVENYNACTAKKKLVKIKGADHGLSYVVDSETYAKEIEDFFGDIL